MSADLPPSVADRLPGYRREELLSPAGAALLVATLLEDGTSAELAWLAGALGRPTLAAWLAARGGRQLSARSRALWTRRLGPAPATPELARELWPLA
jgi:hypothetical protein